ncbi:efflux RND transporter permease subunit [Spectribacter hydrogenooxidans]|uniref:Efflux RND transporter permease subunit n=1 Tax=Spectribacter hydrogenoxidans TaxID=3075608 RepID=A0ABU3C379_9GAMM|nr:efflux RND transporter permease subunit [Salinisphaera sp. W335]MDT0636013.1 efflux RND transporter permease subunit [Salinisphaera sp. W335]
MLGILIDFALRLRGVVLALALMLFGYGGWMLTEAGLDIFPEFSPKQVVIQTESPGLTAEQVEVQVSQPIENALAGLMGLKLIRSQSMQGLSVVTLIFQPDTDTFRNRQIVAERLGTVGNQLPPGAEAPVMVPLSSSSATVMTIGVTSPSASLMDLRDAVDGTLVPRLLSVPGVADVNVFGGDIRQLQIQVDPDALRAHGISLARVRTAALRATGVRGAGFLANDNQQLPVTVTGTPQAAESLREVTLASPATGRRLQLADIATVEEAAAPAFGAAQIMGEPAVVMMVIGQYQANTLTVSRDIENALDDLDVVLAADDIELHDHLFRPADYIEASFSSIAGHLMVGAGFVVIVLLVFLYNWRAAVISALAIPLSLLGATILLLAFGINLNVMVLGGLAIALGEVVDDAIIDTENIARRLRENRALAQPRSFLPVIYDASMEVRGSVVYATFIVILAFVPLLTLGGVAGRLFAPLGLAYILAILVSLLVALTITPALAAMLLTGRRESADEPPVTRWLKPRYERVLARTETRPRVALIAALAVSAGGVALLPLFGGSFLPELREGHYIVHTTSLPGTSLEESIRHGKQLTEQWREIPGIRSVSQWAGRAERGADTYGTHYSEYEIDFEKGLSGPEQQEVIDALNAVLRDFPGISYESNTFLTERIDETISGYTSPVVVNIFGHDLPELDRLAAEVADVIRDVPGAAEVQVRSSADVPLMNVSLDNQRLAMHGIPPLDAVEAIRTAYRGDVVGHYYEGNRRRDVNLILAPEHRRDPASVGNLPLADSDGRLRPLDDVARVEQVAGRYNVLHEGAQRVQTVTADVDGRDLASFFDALRTRVLADVEFSAETYPEFTGAALEQAEARRELILHSLLAGGGILVMIFVALRSVRNVALVLLNLPFSLVGGVVAAWLTGGWLSIGSLVGFVTLFGITVRNSIMLASHYQHLVADEGLPWNAETARRGARERLTAILVTALVTALAMLPIAIGSDNPGREIMGPMAAIIIGGLVSSTVLNLLVLPSVLLRYGRFGAARLT